MKNKKQKYTFPKAQTGLEAMLIEKATEVLGGLKKNIGEQIGDTNPIGMFANSENPLDFIGKLVNNYLLNPGALKAKLLAPAAELNSLKNNANLQRDEQERLAQASLQNRTRINTDPNGLNNVPVYFQNGGYVNDTGYLPEYETSSNPYNIIPSSYLSMVGVPHDVLGVPNKGKPRLMKANSGKYSFEGADYVTEFPIRQNGGDIPESFGMNPLLANAEAESGEVFLGTDGEIKKVAESEPSHEEGGSLQSVQRVLEDTSTTRKDKNSKFLKITPKEAKEEFNINIKSPVSHSKLYELITEKNHRELRKQEKAIEDNLNYIQDNNGGVFAEKSLNQNTAQLNSMPTDAQIFDLIFNRQEDIKRRYNISNNEDEFQNGGRQNNERSRKAALKRRELAKKQAEREVYEEAMRQDTRNRREAAMIEDSNSRRIVPTTELSPAQIAGREAMLTDSAIRRGEYVTPATDVVEPTYTINNILPKYETPTMYNGELPSSINMTTGELNNRLNRISPIPELNLNPTKPSKYHEPLRNSDVASDFYRFVTALNRHAPVLEQLRQNPLTYREADPQRELNQGAANFRAVSDMLPNNASGMANAANLFANKYNIDSQIISKYAQQNQQGQMAIDAQNAQNQYQTDTANIGLRRQFTQDSLQSQEAQRQEKLRAIDSYFNKVSQNRALNRNMNLVAELTPFFDQYGRFNGNKYEFRFNSDGTKDILDKTTKQVLKKDVKTDANGNVKTSETVTTTTEPK